MPPILHAAPPWQPDRSDFAILWHGCTAFDKDVIEKNLIDVTVGRPNTDFGRGFYTTTLERQARHWAWNRFYEWQAAHPGVTSNQPVVLRFRVPRHGPGGLDGLLSLHFVLSTYNSEDYWSLVQHCRQSNSARANDHRHPDGWYDLVSGPVAAFWQQRVAIQDSDQFSFHTKRGADVLNRRLTKGKGKGASKTGNPDYYQWRPV